MQYQISSAMASFCRELDLRTAMEEIKESGFDALDFPFSVYSSGPDTPMAGDDWQSWVGNLKNLSEELRLPIHQAHATWKQAIGEDFQYEPPREIYYRTMEACRATDCHQLIFHPLRQPGRVETPEFRQKIHEYNVRWFRDLRKAAEEYDVIINLENTFDSHHVQLPGDPPYPYTGAEDMLALARDIGGDHVGICLDTGHANISGQNIPAMIRTYGEKMTTVHLNDNYGLIAPVYEDLHLFPGCGRICWDEVFGAMKEIRFHGVYNVEPVAELKRMPDSVRRIQLRAGADSLRALLAEV